MYLDFYLFFYIDFHLMFIYLFLFFIYCFVIHARFNRFFSNFATLLYNRFFIFINTHEKRDALLYFNVYNGIYI